MMIEVHRRVLTGHRCLAVAAATVFMVGCSSDDDAEAPPAELTATIATIAQEDARCDFGGAIVRRGTDTNRNGTLDTDEVEAEEVVCNDSAADAAPAALISSLVAGDAMPGPGESTTLTVTAVDSAGGTAVTYAWSNATTETALAETSNVLTIEIPESATVGDEITYRVTVTDSAQVQQIRDITLTVGEPATAPVTTASTTNHQIFLPEGLEAPTEQPTGDFDGVVFFAGEGSVESRKRRSLRDLAGFGAQRRALSQASSQSQDEFDQMRNAISSEAGYTLTNISTALTNACAVGRFSLELDAGTTPTDLVKALLELVGRSTGEGTLGNLPESLEDELAALLYEMRLSVCYFSQEDVVVLLSLVIDDVADLYENVSRGVTDGTNVGDTQSTREQQTDQFTGTGSGGQADFLFVIDNSGSMGNEQEALSQAAAEFINVITSSGLDFQIGTITTDSQTLQGQGYTNDTNQFAADASPGTGGSGTESGVYFAERSLLSTALGDAEDGSSTSAGYPRAGASLSVVIMSDEPDQYSRYASSTFDVQNNLFVDRSYPVYAIINEGSPGDYDDLALATGGSTASIADTSQFPPIMNEIARNAGGAASLFQLTEEPISSTIVVEVDGTRVQADGMDGWQYVAGSNSIVFRGSAVPASGAVIDVTYQYIAEAEAR